MTSEDLSKFMVEVMMVTFLVVHLPSPRTMIIVRVIKSALSPLPIDDLENMR